MDPLVTPDQSEHPRAARDPIRALFKNLTSAAQQVTPINFMRPAKDRRRYPRIPMVGTLEYRMPVNQDWHEGIIQDFSRGGVRIVVPELVPVGAAICLRLTLPMETRATEVQGRVAWASSSSVENDSTQIGVSFNSQSTYQIEIIEAAINEMITVALRSASELNAQQSLTIVDLQNSLALAYREYEADWYGTRDDWTIHCNRIMFQRGARTFHLEKQGELLGTLSLIPDSEFGLPCDAAFPAEIQAMRSSDRYLAEATLLALDTDLLAARYAKTYLARMAASLRLLTIAFTHVREIGATDLIVTVPPAHQNLYSYILFKTISDTVRSHYGRPSVAMHLDIRQAIETARDSDNTLLSYLYQDNKPANAMRAAVA